MWTANLLIPLDMVIVPPGFHFWFRLFVKSVTLLSHRPLWG